jgi:DeoR/GlpR family transcriptional regulator of sugar metabolism
VIGGRVDPLIGAALGGRTWADIEALRPDVALLGVCALDPVAGAAAFDPEDAEIKRAAGRKASIV